jgi:glycosyltransferase involved in cell wall biosynthesis
MNIAYVAPVVYPFVKGGAEKRIHEVGRRLADRGHEITIYSRHWWDGSKVQQQAGMTLRAVGPPRELYADGDRRSITGALELAARLAGPLARRADDHDLLVAPVAPYFHIFSARLAGRLRSTPLVTTWHEVWADYWYQHIGQLGRAGVFVEQTTARLSQHPVVPSEMVADQFRNLTPSRAEPTVIPNGIDTEKIRTTDPADEGFDVLFAGRLIGDKNVGLLLDAFDAAATDTTTLGIIGDGPRSHGLRRHAAQLSTADRITFLGFLDEYDDVLAHMQQAAVFVSPSTREGFGITLLEAMAADCTVITVNDAHSAGSEIVGDAGFVTQPTTETVGAAIRRALAGDQPEDDPVARAADYDWSKITTQTEDYFNRLLAAPNESLDIAL